MTLLSYEIFNQIIEQGNFARTAEVMNLTPSAISHAVSAMEEEIGTEVFVRDKNGVKLTPTGEQLYPYVRRVLRASNDFEDALDRMRGLESGIVKIGCTNTVCTAWMPEIIIGFKQIHPGIEVQVAQGSYSDVNEWTKRGVIDMGIISEKACTDLDFEKLYEDELLCVTPKDYFKENSKEITPSALEHQPFVVQQDSYDKDINSYLYSHNLEIRANCRISDEQSTLAMVECGEGVSIMPKMFMDASSYDVDTYPLKPKEYRILGLFYSDRTILSTAARALLKHIREYVKIWQQE